MDGKAPSRVIGMLALRGVSCDDCPDDIERRFSLTLSELSRLAGRLRLLDTWEAAGAMKSNRYRPAADEAPCHAVRAEAAALPALAEHKQQPTLQ
jgi:hypothetical protein